MSVAKLGRKGGRKGRRDRSGRQAGRGAIPVPRTLIAAAAETVRVSVSVTVVVVVVVVCVCACAAEGPAPAEYDRQLQALEYWAGWYSEGIVAAEGTRLRACVASAGVGASRRVELLAVGQDIVDVCRMK